ncbi:MAG: hypothetical protein AAF828_09755 [Bacteroidota bacterium]
MSLLRNLARAERMHRMIKFKRSGTPEQFAAKMDMSLSSLYGAIKELKELGAPIGYCKTRQCYHYTETVEFRIGFEKQLLSTPELRSIQAAGRVIPISFMRSIA